MEYSTSAVWEQANKTESAILPAGAGDLSIDKTMQNANT